MKSKILAFLLFTVVFLYSRTDQKDPSWTYLKRSENLKIRGEYALAIIEAQTARALYIEEKIDKFYQETREANRDKTDYEIKKIVESKREELAREDTYPQYHELLGDLYAYTGALNDAEYEYKKALEGEKYFEYPQKGIEIKYKLADVYAKSGNFDLGDIVYREIVEGFFKTKPSDYWDRIKVNIKNDPTLSRVFRIYRIEGMEYLKALFHIGKRSALLQRKQDALYYLSLASVVWMTYYSELIKESEFDFTYVGPADFVNFINEKGKYEYSSNEYIIDEALFYIGYIYYLDDVREIKDYFFNVSKAFTKGTNKEAELFSLIDFLNKKAKEEIHILKYNEIINW